MAAVIVHGGAWAIPDSLAGASTEGCEKAAVAAHGALLAGKSALDAGIRIGPGLLCIYSLVSQPTLILSADRFQYRHGDISSDRRCGN